MSDGGLGLWHATLTDKCHALRHTTRALAPPEAHCPHSPTHLLCMRTSFDPTRMQHTLSSPYPLLHCAPTPPPTQPAHSPAPDTAPGAKHLVSPVLVQLARLCRWRWLPLGRYAGARHAETTKSEVRMMATRTTRGAGQLRRFRVRSRPGEMRCLGGEGSIWIVRRRVGE
jgi:hypothetical protein